MNKFHRNASDQRVTTPDLFHHDTKVTANDFSEDKSGHQQTHDQDENLKETGEHRTREEKDFPMKNRLAGTVTGVVLAAFIVFTATFRAAATPFEFNIADSFTLNGIAPAFNSNRSAQDCVETRNGFRIEINDFIDSQFAASNKGFVDVNRNFESFTFNGASDHFAFTTGNFTNFFGANVRFVDSNRVLENFLSNDVRLRSDVDSRPAVTERTFTASIPAINAIDATLFADAP